MAVLSRLDIEISANSARFQQEIQEVSAVSRRAAAQLQRDQRQQAQSRLDIERQYASQERQAQIDLTDEIIRIRQARFNMADENRYTQQAIQAAQRRAAEVAAIEQNKARESAEKAATNRLQIERQYASDHRKIEIDLAHELERIRAAGFNHDDQNRLIQQARERAQAQVDALASQTEQSKGLLASMWGNATETYSKAKLAYMGIAGAVGAVSAAVGFLIKDQVELATELNNVALKANTTASNIQKYAAAAKMMGIESDKLGDIYKDVQDKIGDFLNTGGGELQDFMKNIGEKAGLTTKKLREMSGPDALQAMWNAIEKANVAMPEAVNYLEAMGDEASLLIPVLQHNGEAARFMNDMLEKTGAKMDEKTIKATRELRAATDLMNLSYQGVKNQIAAQFMPVLSDLAAAMVKDKTLKDQAAIAGHGLAEGLKVVVNTGLGVVGIFRMMGTGAGALAAAIAHPTQAIEIMKSSWADMKDIYAQVNRSMGTVANAGNSGVVNPTVEKYAGYTEAYERFKAKYGKTGAETQEEDKAAKEAAKATAAGKYAPVPVNSKVLAHAQSYGYANLEKRYGLPAGLLSAISMQESRGNPNATSYVGAKGEFQFMPGTARRFGIGGQERNTAVAAEAAAKYLSQHLRMFGNLDKAIAAYNAGEGNVQKVKWDTIMSNRFAKGQTFDYVKKVRGYLSFMNGGKAIDGGYDIASAMANEAQNQQKIEEQKLALQAKYSLESEKRTAEHLKNIAEIKKTFTNPNDPVRKQLLDQEAADYAHDVNEYELAQAKKVAAFTDFKKSERQLILQNANFDAREKANDNKLTLEQKILAMDSIAEQRELKLKAIDVEEAKQKQAANAGHQTAVENIKAEAQIQRDELALNITMSAELREAMMRKINAAEQANLQKASDDFKAELDSINSYKTSAVDKIRADFDAKIAANDRRTDISPEKISTLREAMTGAKLDAIRVARTPYRQAYDEAMAQSAGVGEDYAIDTAFSQRMEKLDQQRKEEAISEAEWRNAQLAATREYYQAKNNLTIDRESQIANAASSIIGSLAGKNSKAYRAMFAVEKGFAIAKSIMAIQTAMASTAMTMPFPANLGAMVTVATQMASIVSNIQAIRMPDGQAHDGIMSVPESGTWNLQKGERVLPEHTAKRLDKTLDKVNTKSGGGDIIINNYSSNTVTARRDGNLTIIDVRNEIDTYVPEQLSKTNTPISQALRNNTTAQRRV